jgi:hypothetical protein
MGRRLSVFFISNAKAGATCSVPALISCWSHLACDIEDFVSHQLDPLSKTYVLWEPLLKTSFSHGKRYIVDLDTVLSSVKQRISVL